jgi:hypothetical protein
MAIDLNGITNYLREQSSSPLQMAMIQRSLTPGTSQTRRGSIPNVGQFGTSGGLPTNPGPIDPPILTGGQNYAGSNYGGGGNHGGDYWTRMDPGMGYIDPSVTIYPGNPADAPPVISTENPSPPNATQTPTHINPRTNPAPAVNPTTTTQGGGPAPYWFQPGYQLPSGIAGAVARGDYSQAYGQSAESRLANFIADSQRFGGGANHMTVPDAGRDRFENLGTFGGLRGHVDEFGIISAMPSNPNIPSPIQLQIQNMRTRSGGKFI